MEQLTDTHLMVMGLAFLGTFLLVVLVGGAFIVIRTRQQNKSELPPPEPPPMTVDVVNATKDAHLPPPNRPCPPPQRKPAPPAYSDPAEVSSSLVEDSEQPTLKAPPPKPRVTLTPIDERPITPVAGAVTEPEDATERIAAPAPDKPFISTADLIDAEADSATVIIDRSQPNSKEFD